MNIILVAEESAGVQALRLLIKSSHNLVALLASSKNTQNLTNITSVARSMGVEVLPASLVRDPGFTSWIVANNVDVLINVHSLYVICSEILDILPAGAFNLHPGALPEYAGLNAPSWSIYNGETEHSVTLHRINKEGIDTGEIISEAVFPLTPSDTGLSVSMNCVKKGLPLIKKLLLDLQQDPSTVSGRPQELTNRNYYRRKQIPGSGKITWTDSAKRIDAFIRASNYSPFSSPWGIPKTMLGDKEISIVKTEIYNEPCTEKPGTTGGTVNGKTAIATGTSWILINHCLVEGKFTDPTTILKPGDLLC